VRTRVVEYDGEHRREHEDRLATEEPLEIRLAWPGAPARRIGVTMRTPGHDFELAAGWLVHDGVLAPGQIASVRYCTDVDLDPLEEFNVVTVEADAPPLRLPEARALSSACGVCGSTSIGEVTDRVATAAADGDVQVPLEVVRGLPERLREAQPGFDRTGGLHAAGLFEADGTQVVVREDVGRHNAVDKAVGAILLSTVSRPGGSIPPVLVLSGRVGFELVQKAVVSGVAVLVAVGAPSSLAVALAEESGLGLVGFTRPDRCVVYAGDRRLGV
jgi:FdhD protein